MTSKNYRAHLLHYIKLCASSQTFRWIQTGVTVQKRSILVKIDDFSPRMTLKFDGWPWKAIGHPFYVTVTFFNVVVGPGHRTVSRAATCWAGRYPGPTISVTFASVFKTGRYWHGCAWVQLADWAQPHLYQCKPVYLPVLFSFIYRLCRSCKLLITPLLGPVLVGLRLAGRTTWLVVVSQVTATVDKSSLFTSSFMADICSTLVRI